MVKLFVKQTLKLILILIVTFLIPLLLIIILGIIYDLYEGLIFILTMFIISINSLIVCSSFHYFKFNCSNCNNIIFINLSTHYECKYCKSIFCNNCKRSYNIISYCKDKRCKKKRINISN